MGENNTLIKIIIIMIFFTTLVYADEIVPAIGSGNGRRITNLLRTHR